MNSISSAYKLPFSDGVTSHFSTAQFFVRDAESNDIEMHLQARVRSGDYFMTVATELERIVQELPHSDMAQAAELERIITELLILSKRYTVIKK